MDEGPENVGLFLLEAQFNRGGFGFAAQEEGVALQEVSFVPFQKPLCLRKEGGVLEFVFVDFDLEAASLARSMGDP